jgi:predicted transcriptional regulator
MNSRIKLKKIIMERGLTVKDAADQMGITGAHLGSIIKGKANAGLKSAPRIIEWAKPERLRLLDLTGYNKEG